MTYLQERKDVTSEEESQVISRERDTERARRNYTETEIIMITHTARDNISKVNYNTSHKTYILSNSLIKS